MSKFLEAIITTFAKKVLHAIERHFESNNWITIILVACFLCLTLAKILFPKRFVEFTSLSTSGSFLKPKGHEFKPMHPFNILLFLVNLLSVSLFFFIAYRFLVEPQLQEPLVIYIRILTAYGCFVLLKFCAEKIIANVFSIDEKVDSYLLRKLNHRNFMALFLLFCCILLTYSFTPNTYLLYGIIVLVLLSNLISLFGTYKKNQSYLSAHWFYFILYLCALEIAPYIILYKLFTNLYWA